MFELKHFILKFVAKWVNLIKSRSPEQVVEVGKLGIDLRLLQDVAVLDFAEGREARLVSVVAGKPAENWM